MKRLCLCSARLWLIGTYTHDWWLHNEPIYFVYNVSLRAKFAFGFLRQIFFSFDFRILLTFDANGITPLMLLLQLYARKNETTRNAEMILRTAEWWRKKNTLETKRGTKSQFFSFLLLDYFFQTFADGKFTLKKLIRWKLTEKYKLLQNQNGKRKMIFTKLNIFPL